MRRASEACDVPRDDSGVDVSTLDSYGALVPPIEDRSGYRARRRHFTFLSINDEQITGWRQRDRSLAGAIAGRDAK